MLTNLIVQEGERKKIKPIQTYTSPTSSISLGNPISFNHNLQAIDFSKSLTVNIFLICTQDQHGYQVGDMVTPERGISVQVTGTQFVVRPADNGVYIVRANNGRWSKINAGRWDLFLTSILL